MVPTVEPLAVPVADQESFQSSWVNPLPPVVPLVVPWLDPLADAHVESVALPLVASLANPPPRLLPNAPTTPPTMLLAILLARFVVALPLELLDQDSLEEPLYVPVVV